MKVVITGASNGIGKACADKFLANNHTVHGIDIAGSSIFHDNYTHHQVDVRDKEHFPVVSDVDILINSAGVQFDDCLGINLKGLINTTEVYGLQPNIKSICNMASVSAHNGAEFPEYTASKGGVLAYTKWTAKQIAKYGATCNSISFGGVKTQLNCTVMNDSDKWAEIMSMTPLKKWAEPEECAEWVYFLTVVNRSCSGQDIIVDNLEMLNHKFVW